MPRSHKVSPSREADRLFHRVLVVVCVVAGFFLGLVFVSSRGCSCLNGDKKPTLYRPTGFDGEAVVTAYTSRPEETDSTPTITASNKEVYDGLVANNCLPFGTKVRFPNLFGDKVFTVDDRMNRRYGCEAFDVWYGYGSEDDVRRAKMVSRRRTAYEVVR